MFKDKLKYLEYNESRLEQAISELREDSRERLSKVHADCYYHNTVSFARYQEIVDKEYFLNELIDEFELKFKEIQRKKKEP